MPKKAFSLSLSFPCSHDENVRVMIDDGALDLRKTEKGSSRAIVQNLSTYVTIFTLN